MPSPSPPVGGIGHERLDVVRVALLDGLGLTVEARLLLLRVVDLGERVPELHAAREVLEALGERGSPSVTRANGESWIR